MMNWATCKLGISLVLRQAREFLSSCKHRRWSWALLHLSAGFVLSSDTCVAALGYGTRCPVCGWQGRRYFHCLSACEPHLRPNAMCPQCGALERQRDVASWLKHQEGGYPRVLNVAPNPGLAQFLMSKSGSFVITLDISRSDVMFRMDLHNLGFPGECFDLIVCSHVLEHVQDDIRCIGELFRVLKPEGVAILPVPIEDRAYTVGFGDPRKNGHRRAYGRDYFDRLRNAGFVPIPEAQHIAAVTKRGASSPRIFE